MSADGTQAPLVSVLMAARDCASYVEEAVESVLAQEDVRFELLISDDGSADATGEILRAWVTREPRMRLFTNPTPVGLTQCLNAMLPKSRGTYIARMDADDASLPGRFAAQLAYLRRVPEVGILGTWVREIDADGHPLHDLCYPDCHEWITEQLSAGRNPLTHGSLMIRRDLLVSLAPPAWRFRYGQDNDLNLRLMDRTCFGIVPAVLYVRRLHSGSMCSASTYLRPQIKKLALQLHADRRCGRPERDWSTLERRMLESARQEEQAHLMEAYSAARRQLLGGDVANARLLWGQAAQHPKLRLKANLMLFLATLPFATLLVRTLLKVAALRDPMRRYVQQVDTTA